ncbi:MAG TPA: hypothetical protein VFN61_06580 [Acidimicrobiales bacterium]|nr:hypothetical protein [Acidimicrobiales bacterium]
MTAQLCFAPELLHVRPWAPEPNSRPGFDARSSYAEEFWLGVLGPSTMWFLRRIAAGFDYCPEGFDLDMSDTARSLGIGDKTGRHAPLIRAVNRTIQFGMSKLNGTADLLVRRSLPPLNRQQLSRLPNSVQARHALWVTEETDHHKVTEQQQRRACQLALSLADLGEDFAGIERQLLRWQYPGPVARQAAGWALERHRLAFGPDAATGGAPVPRTEARGA